MGETAEDKARQEIAKDIAMFVTLKEVIEKSFCKSEAEKIEERHFAKLQTDIQIILSICLGFFALAGATLIAYAELKDPLFQYLTFFFGGSAIALAVGSFYARRKMEDPKKEKTP
jgi:hypothetical protein